MYQQVYEQLHKNINNIYICFVEIDDILRYPLKRNESDVSTIDFP